MEYTNVHIQGVQVPNPRALKFDCGALLSEWPVEITESENREISPLADILLDLGWIERVFISTSFITVTHKADEATWSEKHNEIRDLILDYLRSGKELFVAGFEPNEVREFPDNEMAKNLMAMLEMKILPPTREDGGEIRFDKFEDGVLHVKLSGACVGCPFAPRTIKHGVEVLAKREFPEVKEVTSSQVDWSETQQ